MARIEATTLGLDRRYVVTNIKSGRAEWLYDSLYCARGQAENPIKLHKSQLASDRTSCRSPLANQVRFGRLTRASLTVLHSLLHTAAYWLMLTVRDAMLLLDALAPVLGALSTLAFSVPASLLPLYLGGFAGFLLYIGVSDILPQAHSQAGPAAALRLFGLTALGAALIHTVVRFAG